MISLFGSFVISFTRSWDHIHLHTVTCVRQFTMFDLGTWEEMYLQCYTISMSLHRVFMYRRGQERWQWVWTTSTTTAQSARRRQPTCKFQRAQVYLLASHF